MKILRVLFVDIGLTVLILGATVYVASFFPLKHETKYQEFKTPAVPTWPMCLRCDPPARAQKL